MQYKNIRLEISDQVATLYLNRPPANLLTIQAIDEINEALLSLHRRNDLEVLVLRGSPNVFSDGLDIGELVPATAQRLVQVYVRLFETLRMMDVVQIAAVEGRAHGAGWEVAIGTNLFVASAGATFSLPHTSRGIIPPIASAIMPRIAPRRMVMEWILTGRSVTAEELHHHGVVNRVFDPARFDEQLDAFVAEITSKSGPVLAIAKKAQFEAYYSTFSESISRVQSLFLRDLMDLEDAREGLDAEREGRSPVWKNR